MKTRFLSARTASIMLVAFACASAAQAQIHVDQARIGCLDIQKSGNLTAMVGSACNNRNYCEFKAPTPDQYQRAGVQAQTRTFCTQGMEIIYHCLNPSTAQQIEVPGDAWNNPPAELLCGEPILPPVPLGSGATLRGFVDLHTHPLANLGFSGKLIYGGVDIGAMLPADPDCNHNVRATSVLQALGHDTSTHGGNNYSPVNSKPQCGDDIRKAVIHVFQSQGYADPPDDAHGAPDFNDWPKWNDVTHQKMWVDWIRRAYNAGLRVMVALAVNNKTLGDAVAGPGDYPTDDKTSADQQLTEIKAFVARHPDFIEIAFTSADLERIVRANKLAIVLGVEIDNIGNLKGTPSNEAISREIDHLFDQGVRYAFPIHLLDNPFGGTAAYKDLFNFSTFREEGHYWNLGCAPSPMPGSPFSEIINYKFAASNQFLPPLLTIAGFVKLGTMFPLLPGYPGNCLGHNPSTPTFNQPEGLTNQEALTSQGVFAITWMMRRGMFIDIDHMSDNSKAMTIKLAQGMSKGNTIGYPLNSGHSGLRGFFPRNVQRSDNDISERSTTFSQYQAIACLHGMAGVGSAGLAAYQWGDLYRQVLATMASARCPVPVTPIAGFGTDLNGAEIGMPPDVEQDGTTPNPQYTECIQSFNCGDAAPGDTVRRPGGPPAGNSPGQCMAKAQAACKKKFAATIFGCLNNCGHPPVAYSAAFPMSSIGSQSWDYNKFGVAHYGMLADFLQDLRNQRDTPQGAITGATLIDSNLMNGADYFLRTWQKIDMLKDRQLTASAVPASVRPNVATTIVVQAVDSQTHVPVPNAVVHVANQVIPAGKPFQHIFTCSARPVNPRAPGNTVVEPPDFPNPSFAVTAPGFVDTSVEFIVSGIKSGSEICR